MTSVFYIMIIIMIQSDAAIFHKVLDLEKDVYSKLISLVETSEGYLDYVMLHCYFSYAWC